MDVFQLEKLFYLCQSSVKQYYFAILSLFEYLDMYSASLFLLNNNYNYFI